MSNIIKYKNFEITTNYTSRRVNGVHRYKPNSIHENKAGCKAIIIGRLLKIDGVIWNGNAKYLIEFQDEYKHRMIVSGGSISDKEFKNPYHPSVYGHGFIGVPGYLHKDNKKMYDTWCEVLRRVYSEKFHKRSPTYIGVKLHKSWHNFQVYAKWHEENYPGYPTHDMYEKEIRWQLDKDLLSEEGNKMYGPKTCVFLPAIINTFIINSMSTNTSGYRGIIYNEKTNTWNVRISLFAQNRTKSLGYYKDPKYAGIVYKEAREFEVVEAKKYMKNLGFEKYIIDKIK